MPRSNDSDGSDQHTLLSHDSVELGFDEKLPQHRVSPSCFGRFISFCREKWLAISVATAVAIGGFTLVVLAASFRTPSAAAAAASTKHCGSSADEAMALGCIFDVINYSWQPPECFDQEIYDRYWKKSQEKGPLKLYADSTFTEPLPQDLELLKHTPFVWAEHRFHVLHCMYALELVHHALTRNKPVMEFISRFNHTTHCTDTALEEDWVVKDTSIKASYNRCVDLV